MTKRVEERDRPSDTDVAWGRLENPVAGLTCLHPLARKPNVANCSVSLSSSKCSSLSWYFYLLIKSSVMWFGSDGVGQRSGGSGPEPTAEKDFLKHLWCKNVVLLKLGDGIRGQKELPRDCEERLGSWGPEGVGWVKARLSSQKDFCGLKRTHEILEA